MAVVERNNLQMKNNQFRSNAISRRAVGQTEPRSCQSAPLLPKQRLRTAEHGEQERVERDGEIISAGRGNGWGTSQDIRRMAGGGGVVDFLQ